MRAILFIAVCIMAPLAGWSQIETNPLHSVPYIEVTGVGEMEIVPDQIYVTFSLKERYDGRTKLSIEEQERKVKQLLMRAGIDLDNLSLSDAAADYMKVRWLKKDVVATKDYQIKLANTTELAKTFEVLDEVNVENAAVSRVDHSNMEEFRKQVKIMAIRSAREKAAYLLESIGEEVGKPLYVIERENFNDYQPKLMMANMRMLDGGMQEESLPELSFQKIKLDYRVFVRFAIQ